MSPAIAAIATKYRGYRFRSRLEARWAVLFDSLQIQFEYEPEGFVLPDQTCYLPDFYLPKVRMYAEVKPEKLTDAEMLKCHQLACGSGRDTLLLVGPPDFRTYDAILVFPVAGETVSQISDFLLDIDYHKRKYYERESRLFGCCGRSFEEEADFTPQYCAAVYAARSYRFEEAA